MLTGPKKSGIVLASCSGLQEIVNPLADVGEKHPLLHHSAALDSKVTQLFRSMFQFLHELSLKLRKLILQVVVQQRAEAGTQCFDALACVRKISPGAFGEQLSLGSVALDEGSASFKLVPVLDHVPAELKYDIAVLSKSQPIPLIGRTISQEVGFGDDTQGTLPLWVDSASVLQDNLVCIAGRRQFDRLDPLS